MSAQKNRLFPRMGWALLRRKEREALRKAKVLLSQIKSRQGQLSVLERCKLSEEDRNLVKKMKGELQELEEDARFHIDLLKGTDRGDDVGV